MSKEEIEKYKVTPFLVTSQKLFKEFDMDSNGYLDKDELKEGTKKMGSF
jgi:Ca2+-binding EF-hand superfamily protein